MVSDIITITSSGENFGAALEEAQKVADYKGLSTQSTLHLRLLTEEMLGMMHSITGENSGKFWIEEDFGEYQLHLQVETVVSKEKREELLAASSSGKNEASKGLMGALREFFFRGADEDIAAYNNPLLNAGATKDAAASMTDWQWSLTRYQDNLRAMDAEKPEVSEAWDELEKSVVKNLADDVKISIKGWQTELIIIKKMD